MYVTFPAVSVCAFFRIYNPRRVRWCGLVRGQNVFYVNKTSLKSLSVRKLLD